MVPRSATARCELGTRPRRSAWARGTTWGHNGGVPGYNSFASNSRDGKQNLVMMVSAEPDARTGPLLDLALNTATCNMFGQNLNDQAMGSTVPLLRTKSFDSFLN